MDSRLSVKRILIDKANSSMTVMVTLAACSLISALVLSFALVKQLSYRTRVVSEKKRAASALKQNSQAVSSLVTSFEAFDSASESLIGTKDKNSKIVLDALPSKYDFPALAASLEKILSDGGYSIESLSGIDNESSALQTRETKPKPVEMAFSLSIKGPYDKVIQVVSDLERSIRPIVIDNLDMSGTSTDTKLSLQARTYYQPGKNLETTTKDIK